MFTRRSNKRPGAGSAARGKLYQQITQAGAEFRSICDRLDDETRESIMASWHRMKAASCQLSENYREQLQNHRPAAPSLGVSKRQRDAATESTTVDIYDDAQEHAVAPTPQAIFTVTDKMDVNSQLTMSLDDIIYTHKPVERKDDTAMDNVVSTPVSTRGRDTARRLRVVVPAKRSHARRARDAPASRRVVKLPRHRPVPRPAQRIEVGNRTGYIQWD